MGFEWRGAGWRTQRAFGWVQTDEVLSLHGFIKSGDYYSLNGFFSAKVTITLWLFKEGLILLVLLPAPYEMACSAPFQSE